MNLKLLEGNYVPLVKTYIAKERMIPYGQAEINSPAKVVDIAERLLKGADREYVLVISTDTKCKPVGIEVVSVGTLDAAIVNPREVFKHAILCNAESIVMIHNHPSGDPEPSREDVHLTKKMKLAGEILGIELIDHIIVGEEGKYYSFSEKEDILTKQPKK